MVGALVVREIGPLRDYVVSVLAHAREGDLALIAVVTVVNGIAEEIFFRGALFAAIGRRHPVLISTGVYALATVATANPMLVFAALTLGTVLGLQRRASGGILAPIITHVTWSTAHAVHAAAAAGRLTRRSDRRRGRCATGAIPTPSRRSTGREVLGEPGRVRDVVRSSSDAARTVRTRRCRSWSSPSTSGTISRLA